MCDIITLILNVIFATCAPFLTLLYLKDYFTVLLLIALIINLFALAVVAVLAIVALKKEILKDEKTEDS